MQQVHIQWGPGPAADTAWELTTEFQKAYPHFNLEEKVELDGKGNVRKKKQKAGKGRREVSY